jgi:thiamine-monophosphate kinase
MRERELIEWIQNRAPATGDDCAVLPCEPWGELLVTVDAVIDGVHARWSEDGPRAFGYKAVARGLSDIAAMGGTPLWVVLAATLPPGTSDEDARAVVLGAEDAGCPLVGGDTAKGPFASVTATVLGRSEGAILRSGARIGDRIVVSGPLGNSLESGWHLRFTPRVAEAQDLRARCDVGAMIDLSDGLAADLFHILDASDVGAKIDPHALPLRKNADLQGAYHDGEDYELLATIGRGDLPPAPFVIIGEIVPTAETELPFERGGYEHRD